MKSFSAAYTWNLREENVVLKLYLYWKRSSAFLVPDRNVSETDAFLLKEAVSMTAPCPVHLVLWNKIITAYESSARDEGFHLWHSDSCLGVFPSNQPRLSQSLPTLFLTFLTSVTSASNLVNVFEPSKNRQISLLWGRSSANVSWGLWVKRSGPHTSHSGITFLCSHCQPRSRGATEFLWTCCELLANTKYSRASSVSRADFF